MAGESEAGGDTDDRWWGQVSPKPGETRMIAAGGQVSPKLVGTRMIAGGGR